MDARKFQVEIEKKVQKKLAPLFTCYKSDFGSLQAIIKRGSTVLIIGNYSSGKSTFINEMLGREIQRTGQAPTDDSFTIITSDGSSEENVPGATLVNDVHLPYSQFKDYGDQFISHFSMKKIDTPFLKNMTLIDSPGMLDAETEKDRGYNYMKVMGEFAKLADLVVLMFDPQKPGTIKETYTVVRDTLPKSSSEDRIVFAMTRIDECDNLSDLVRSYGTLCWNLSQMTGRKDIPHIFLTYSPVKDMHKLNLEEWQGERDELKQKILSAPALRFNHILEGIDRQVNELKMIAEVMTKVSDQSRSFFHKTILLGFLIAVPVVFFLDYMIRAIANLPTETMLEALLAGHIQPYNFAIPLCGLIVILVVSKMWIKRYLRRWKSVPKNIVSLDTDYRKQLWKKIEKRVQNELHGLRLRDIWFHFHQKNLNRINKFINRDLKEFYERIKSLNT